ncbi:hypothetical protein HPB47_016574, partial [Ixodes persulcatus]
MGSKIWLCVFMLLLSCLVAQGQDVISHAEFKKRLLSVNPGLLTPQCKKIFKNCSVKMLSLLSVIDGLKQRWDEYLAVPCVKTMLEHHFPDYSVECAASGRYGESMKCIASPEATAFVDPKRVAGLMDAI